MQTATYHLLRLLPVERHECDGVVQVGGWSWEQQADVELGRIGRLRHVPKYSLNQSTMLTLPIWPGKVYSILKVLASYLQTGFV